jgi:hypothetical protein
VQQSNGVAVLPRPEVPRRTAGAVDGVDRTFRGLTQSSAVSVLTVRGWSACPACSPYVPACC